MNLKFEEEGSDVFLGKILGEILFHIAAIENYSQNITPDEYAENEQIQDAISMRLQSIGERLKLITGKTIISDPFGIMSNFPEIHWNEIKGMRDYLAHDYSALDILYPWKALITDLPKIKSAIEDICKAYPKVETSSEFSIADLKFRRARKKENFKKIFDASEDESEEDDERSPGY